MRQQKLTLLVPVKKANLQALQSHLEKIGDNIAGNEWLQLARSPSTHFARFVILGPAPACRLLFSACHAGSPADYLDELVQLFGPALEDRDPIQSQNDVRRHRILRRGAAYGPPLPEGTTPDDGTPRGLLFICINADIKRQFEFIQQTWANNPKFHGLYGDRDPLIGDNIEPNDDEDHLAPRTYTIQCEGVRTRLNGIPRFVTMKGGAYFFLPSLTALHYLARAPRSTSSRDAASLTS